MGTNVNKAKHLNGLTQAHLISQNTSQIIPEKVYPDLLKLK